MVVAVENVRDVRHLRNASIYNIPRNLIKSKRCMLCVVSLCFLNHFELGRCLTVAEPDFDLGVGGGGGKGRFLDLPNPGIFSFFCFFFDPK